MPSSIAEDHTSHTNDVTAAKPTSAIEALSPELRALLSKEMQALQQGMISIIPAYIAGNWGEIATTAEKMQASYILKQNLTQPQMHELHSKLPPAFIQLDQQFHYLAGMLKHVASEKKSELVGFYFAKLSESCLSCHSQYASHKFPAFAKQEMKSKAEHHEYNENR
jgi:exonuclease VII large subunit